MAELRRGAESALFQEVSGRQEKRSKTATKSPPLPPPSSLAVPLVLAASTHWFRPPHEGASAVHLPPRLQ